MSDNKIYKNFIRDCRRSVKNQDSLSRNEFRRKILDCKSKPCTL